MLIVHLYIFIFFLIFFICSEFCHTLKWNSHGFTLYIFFREGLSSPCPVFQLIYLSFYFWVVRIFVLYILNTELLSDVWFANIFSHFVEFLYFLDNVIWCTKVLNFDKVPFTYFFFCSCACGIKSKNLLSNLKSQTFTPLFSSNSFRAFSSVQFSRSVMSNSLWPHEPGLRVHNQLRVYSNSCPSQWCHPAISSSVVPFSSIPLGLTIYVIDPFWVTFCVWSKSGVQLYSFACRHQLLPAPPVGETIFFIDWYWHPC